MALKVGDFVRLAEIGIRGGTVVRIDGTTVHVQWSDGFAVPWEHYWLERICRSCHKPRGAHTDEGRCLFGAARWS